MNESIGYSFILFVSALAFIAVCVLIYTKGTQFADEKWGPLWMACIMISLGISLIVPEEKVYVFNYTLDRFLIGLNFYLFLAGTIPLFIAENVWRYIRLVWVSFVVWRYKKAGLQYGNYCTYILDDKPPSSHRYRICYETWRKRYESLGFQPVSKRVFELVGGGYKPESFLDSELRVPRKN